MKKTYLAPRLEIIEVEIEKGFATSTGFRHVDITTTINGWNQDDIEYSGNALKDNSGGWGNVNW